MYDKDKTKFYNLNCLIKLTAGYDNISNDKNLIEALDLELDYLRCIVD